MITILEIQETLSVLKFLCSITRQLIQLTDTATFFNRLYSGGLHPRKQPQEHVIHGGFWWQIPNAIAP